MVERELVGSECSYWACVPSKALLRLVIAISDARRIRGAREAVNGSIKATAVFGRRDRYVSNWDDTGQADRMAGIGATLVRGHGRLDGPRQVAVTRPGGDEVTLTARHSVVVCTGSRPALPDLPGMAEARPWTNRQATDSSYVPGRSRLSVPGVSVSKWQRPGRDWALQ
jgi:dihydrolipoamide dehydrogenase